MSNSRRGDSVLNDLRISPLVLGTSGLGEGSAPGSPEEATAVELAAALLADGRSIDTSNMYSGGRSEEILGLALREQPEAATRIITKVDRDPETGAFGRDRVLRSYEESLRRLGVDRIGILHLHDPYTVSFDEAVGDGGALAGMRELRDAGAVDAIGIAAGPIPLMRRYVETDAFDVVLSHNRFTLVDRSAEPLFALARSKGMGVFNAAPFGAGILASGVVATASYGYRPASDALRAWAARAEAVCAEHGVSLRSAALRFSMRSPLVDATVVGLSHPERLAQFDALLADDIPDGLWQDLDDLGAAPTPIADDAEEGTR